MILMGNFNARLPGREEGEERMLSKWIYGKGSEYIINMSDTTADIRNRFIQMAQTNDLVVSSTTFERSRES